MDIILHLTTLQRNDCPPLSTRLRTTAQDVSINFLQVNTLSRPVSSEEDNNAMLLESEVAAKKASLHNYSAVSDSPIQSTRALDCVSVR